MFDGYSHPLTPHRCPSQPLKQSHDHPPLVESLWHCPFTQGFELHESVDERPNFKILISIKIDQPQNYQPYI